MAASTVTPAMQHIGSTTSPYVRKVQLTLADIAAGCTLDWLAFRFPEIAWRNEHPPLACLMGKLAQRPSFADTRPA